MTATDSLRTGATTVVGTNFVSIDNTQEMPSSKKPRKEKEEINPTTPAQEWRNRTPNATNFSFAGLLVFLWY